MITQNELNNLKAAVRSFEILRQESGYYRTTPYISKEVFKVLVSLPEPN